MSIYDHHLIQVVRSLNNYERTRAGMFIHIGCPKELFDKFLAHPQIGLWLKTQFPISLRMLKDWDDNPTKDERDLRLDPYRILNDNHLTQRVIMYYTDNGKICAEWMDWENDTRHIFEIEDATKYQAPGLPGTIMDFDNPRSIYLEAMFLEGLAPLYNHDLCIWLAEQMLEVMKSDDARKQSERTRRLSEIKGANDFKTEAEKEQAETLRALSGVYTRD